MSRTFHLSALPQLALAASGLALVTVERHELVTCALLFTDDLVAVNAGRLGWSAGESRSGRLAKNSSQMESLAATGG